MITAEEREDIFRDIWREFITVFALPVILFSDTWNELQKGLFSGFVVTLADFPEGSTEFILLTKLKENLIRFSAAKTFQNVRDTQNFILDTAGNLRPFTDFRKDALKIFDKYNDTWLKTEFETVIANARSADQWEDIQRDKDILPLLKYQTAGDNRVRPLHVSWDGIVKSVDDPFWDTRMPPNDFRCRCIVIQLSKDEEPITKLGERLEKVKKETKGKITSLDNDSELFSINPGKEVFIFKGKGKSPHPYFDVPRDFADLKKRNFNMPLN